MISTVPTVLQRQGIFTEAIGDRVPAIYDPATTVAVAGGVTRTPFFGNTIPAARMDPVARDLLERYPLPTSAGTANNYRRTEFPSTEENNQAAVFNLRHSSSSFSGATGQPRAARQLHKLTFGPRLGMVGRITDKTVARVGYGLDGGHSARLRGVGRVGHPVWTGRGSRVSGVMGALVNDWTVTGVLTLQSGMPLAVTQTTNNNAFAGFGTQRPHLVGDPTLPSDERSVSRWFNTSAFSPAPAFTIGSSSRNPVRGPAYRNLDLAVMRRVPPAGARALELRAEVFNVTNTPPFLAANTTVGSAAFGTITSAGDPRVVQRAVKFVFKNRSPKFVYKLRTAYSSSPEPKYGYVATCGDMSVMRP